MTDPPPPHRRRAHAQTRDLERYAGLFAKRTGVMRSSAMRDLMAITARPEVISLAGGLPDTSTFPPQTFAAQMTRIAQESTAEALQYGPTEGFEETKDCIVEVMAAGMLPDPDDVIVTTGGQQAIDLICKTLVDPGDVVICEAPTYPGAVPVFCSYQADVVQVECDADGMQIEESGKRCWRGWPPRRRRREIRPLGAELQNPAGVTMSGERRRRLVEAGPLARGLRRRGQPLRPAPLRRRAAAPAAGPRRRRLRHLSRHLLEDPLPRDQARLGGGAAAGDGEDRARQAGSRPLHLDPDPVLRARILRRREWRDYIENLVEIYRRRRRRS